MKNYIQFNSDIKKDEALRTEFDAFMAEKGTDNEERYSAIIEFAASKGYEITVEEISAAIASSRKLDNDELNGVSGGNSFQSEILCIDAFKGNKECLDTYRSGENCYIIDDCNMSLVVYKRDRRCKTTFIAGENCWANDDCNHSSNHYPAS